MGRQNVILEKSLAFSLVVVSFCEELYDKKRFIIANQLLKSGTSIGANIHEAQNIESRADFIHKLKIAGKEVDETKYWLLLCEKSEHYPSPGNLMSQIEELSKILYKIISSSKSPLR